jgi:hypothetical protein
MSKLNDSLKGRPALLQVLLAICTVVSMILASGAGSQWI